LSFISSALRFVITLSITFLPTLMTTWAMTRQTRFRQLRLRDDSSLTESWAKGYAWPLEWSRASNTV
jgi:hypothetical protein